MTWRIVSSSSLGVAVSSNSNGAISVAVTWQERASREGVTAEVAVAGGGDGGGRCCHVRHRDVASRLVLVIGGGCVVQQQVGVGVAISVADSRDVASARRPVQGSGGEREGVVGGWKMVENEN